MTLLNITANGTNQPNSEWPVLPPTLGLLFSFFAMGLNGILIVVMVKERKSFFKLRVSYFVINLAVADCLNGVSVAYITLQQLLPQHSFPFLIYVNNLNWITLQSSFYTLFLMSVDRLVIVLYFVRWSNILTIKRTINSIKIVWLVSVTGGVIMYFYGNEMRLAALIFVELCCLIFICNSLVIYPALRKREKGRFETDTEPSTRSFRPVAHDNMSRVVIILMIVLIVTQLPFIFLYQIYLLYMVAGDNTHKYMDLDIYVPAYLYSQALAGLNFVVNPIIYAWRIRAYRKALFKTFMC